MHAGADHTLGTSHRRTANLRDDQCCIGPKVAASTTSYSSFVSILLEFIINLRTFHIAVEFILQGIFGFLLVLTNVASIRPEHQRVSKPINLLFAIIGLILFGIGINHLVSTWGDIDWQQTILGLLMPIWMAAWAALFVLVLGLYTNLERIFRLMGLKNPSWISRFWRILPLANRVGLHPRTIRKCDGYWYNMISSSSGYSEARQVVSEFLQSQADADAKEAAAAQKLIDNAGQQGVDEAGAQLDQREFKETWDALENIMLWFHGWYGKNVAGYDLAKIKQIMSLYDFKGLPSDHGITTHVSPDGESCYAMRKTVSGRVLAVGMHGHDYQYWHWDGDHKPGGYPGQGGDWGTDWATQEFNPNR